MGVDSGQRYIAANVSHDEIRRLLPGYAAGTIDDAGAGVVRQHIADGCLDCLGDVFSRPVGEPEMPVVAPAPPAPIIVEPSPARRSRIVTVSIFVAAIVAAVVTGGVRREKRVSETERASERAVLRDLTALRTTLADRLGALERAGAAAESATRQAEDARAAIADVARQLDSARDRIGELKQEMRHQDVAFREKQQNMEAVIARLSTKQRSSSPVGGVRGGCGSLQGPARDLCTTFCQVEQCDRRPGPECDGLRGRFQALTGSADLPCAVATVDDALTPCDETHVDVWSFDARAGQQYTVTADTVDAATAADLCIVGSCNGTDPFAGDDEAPCHDAPGFACPRTTFVALADVPCRVAVTVCSPGCANPTLARYELRVTGAAELTSVADDTVEPPGGPATAAAANTRS